MNNKTNHVSVHFRFLNLNKLQAYTLVREIPDSSFDAQLTGGLYTGAVELTSFNIDDINDFYVRQMIELSACDIYVHVTSESSTAEVIIPSVVNRMLKYIDCKLTYSFLHQ